MQVVASDDDDEEIDMTGTELLDNLNLINNKGVIVIVGFKGKPDWVTGIQGESWAGEELRAGEQQGRARIEFHGDNVAETIEEEEESGAREERDMEPSMVTTRDWDKQPNHKTYIFHHDSCDCSQYRTIFQLIQILKLFTRPGLA